MTRYTRLDRTVMLYTAGDFVRKNPLWGWRRNETYQFWACRALYEEWWNFSLLCAARQSFALVARGHVEWVLSWFIPFPTLRFIELGLSLTSLRWGVEVCLIVVNVLWAKWTASAMRRERLPGLLLLPAWALAEADLVVWTGKWDRNRKKKKKMAGKLGQLQNKT